MLFNSLPFILWFLPVVLAGYFVIAGTGYIGWARFWLVAASLFFYGWWNPAHVPLLIASMVANYAVGKYLAQHPSKTLLVGGILGNLAVLGYFKYTHFILGAFSDGFAQHWSIPDIVLPLAISFFTFQQIAYLCDAYDGSAVEHNFINYCLFITFFPHLIAGPITHHREMLPQFANPENFRPRTEYLSVGATLFLIGLFKKVMIADQLSEYVGSVFTAAMQREALTLLDAWSGAITHALQLYFDFSGYTDMAIGLGLMFGIRLPINFNSPYKARSVIDFWSRWHMTLTRFLTAYIYNPVVVRISRSRAQKHLPLPKRARTTLGAFVIVVAFPTLLTMFAAGLWHGAGWQYIIFGLLHGAYLVINHAWREIKARLNMPLESGNPVIIAGAILLTFLSVVVALVFFRAHDVPTALVMLSSMAGAGGIVVSPPLME
ncbi:MAG: MBOAT family O-acyltransferase, partial [Dongiaceae bacterium]